MITHKQPPVGESIKKLRSDILQCTQTRLAQILGVTLSTVAKWESGKVQPSPMALMAIGRLDFEHKDRWYELAGQLHADVERLTDHYKEMYGDTSGRNQAIQIHGSVGAGPNYFPTERAEATIMLPRAWFKNGQNVVGLYVRGDSMSPLINDGFLVLVDVQDRLDLKALDGKVVAARNEHGVCIKWLRRHGENFFLISQNVGKAYPPIAVEAEGYSVVGRVVKWIGHADHPSR